jgi:hypothetical protein
VNGKLERMWKVVTVDYFEVLSQHCMEGLRKIMEKYI